MLTRCRVSSGSKSKSEEPSSTRPRRFTLPAANSNASASDVLPTLPCPISATLRTLVTSSIDIASFSPVWTGGRSSVSLVEDAQPVERQELIDLLDGLRFRRKQLGETA